MYREAQSRYANVAKVGKRYKTLDRELGDIKRNLDCSLDYCSKAFIGCCSMVASTTVVKDMSPARGSEPEKFKAHGRVDSLK